MNKINFKLSNFHCESCAKLSSKKISKINGVSDININLTGDGYLLSDRNIDKSEVEDVLKDTNYKIISFTN